MNGYKINMTLQAKTEQEAKAKMAALSLLGSLLDEKTLTGLAHMVKNDPAKTAMAKQYLGV